LVDPIRLCGQERLDIVLALEFHDGNPDLRNCKKKSTEELSLLLCRDPVPVLQLPELLERVTKVQSKIRKLAPVQKGNGTIARSKQLVEFEAQVLDPL
jgi:hypothetical protein